MWHAIPELLVHATNSPSDLHISNNTNILRHSNIEKYETVQNVAQNTKITLRISAKADSTLISTD